MRSSSLGLCIQSELAWLVGIRICTDGIKKAYYKMKGCKLLYWVVVVVVV